MFLSNTKICPEQTSCYCKTTAHFKRNDRMLDIVPAGVIVFPGSGITGNFADKAKKLGIPVLDHRGGGA